MVAIRQVAVENLEVQWDWETGFLIFLKFSGHITRQYRGYTWSLLSILPLARNHPYCSNLTAQCAGECSLLHAQKEENRMASI